MAPLFEAARAMVGTASPVSELRATSPPSWVQRKASVPRSDLEKPTIVRPSSETYVVKLSKSPPGRSPTGVNVAPRAGTPAARENSVSAINPSNRSGRVMEFPPHTVDWQAQCVRHARHNWHYCSLRLGPLRI